MTFVFCSLIVSGCGLSSPQLISVSGKSKNQEPVQTQSGPLTHSDPGLANTAPAPSEKPTETPSDVFGPNPGQSSVPATEPSTTPSSSPIFGPPAPPQTQPNPAPSQNPVVPVVPLDPPPSSRGDRPVYDQVDRHYGHRGELLKERSPEIACAHPGTVVAPTQFARAIDDAVLKNMVADSNPVESGVFHSFSIPLKGKTVATSLVTHPLCDETPAQINQLIRHAADAKTIARIQRFTGAHNALRASWLTSRATTPPAKLVDLWGGFMGCLAYVEALSDPDPSSSDRVAQSVNFKGRPPGVLFYIDPGQSNPESRLNIGNFQFAPASNGNIYSCLLNWNKNVSPDAQSCRAPTKGSTHEMLRWLAEPSQLFNSYCGVNKLVETFFVQVNSTQPTRTPGPNRRAKGALSAPQNRCVTPFISSALAYNHFGPLQNTTGNNLNELMSCVDSAVLDSLGL